jgi:hypothetical protein
MSVAAASLKGSGRRPTEMCSATLADGPLSCVRPDGHLDGHEFHSQHGSWVDDTRPDGGHG